MTWLEENAPTILDGSGHEYRVVGMQATYTLESIESPGSYVTCNQSTLERLGSQQAVLRAFAEKAAR